MTLFVYIFTDTSLLEKSESYKQQNIQLTVEVERLKLEQIKLRTEGLAIK